jgi:hypothetical protein
MFKYYADIDLEKSLAYKSTERIQLGLKKELKSSIKLSFLPG